MTNTQRGEGRKDGWISGFTSQFLFLRRKAKKLFQRNDGKCYPFLLWYNKIYIVYEGG